MARFRPPRPASSEITPERVYRSRRRFLETGALGATGLVFAPRWIPFLGDDDEEDDPTGRRLTFERNRRLSTAETRTPWEHVTGYNNFYELGTGKDDPPRNAHHLKTQPWSVVVDGACDRPGRFGVEDLLKGLTLEERVYRLRCVEGWSMVIPWIGVPLQSVLARHRPTSKARYVAFETLLDPKRLPGQRRDLLEWPYREGLRLDEAMHPLTILAVGVYGRELPGQNGAPLRLVVPWKYGFKSIKSIVRISFRETMPGTTWNRALPHEYGFYANVNPAVDHPRWSQKKERRIGELFRRDTRPFNGYGEQVAGLYRGLDLRKWF